METGQYIHTLSAVVSCVALDENMRPSPGLPKLVDPVDPSYVEKLEATAAQRKELAMRWRRVQESVDQLPRVTLGMLRDAGLEHSPLVSISDTLIEVQNSFLPKHLNRNNTIFGGEVLQWMVRSALLGRQCGAYLRCLPFINTYTQDKVALYCARNFTKNANMVTMSMNRIFFKLPITMDDIVTMHARICSVRYGSCAANTSGGLS